MRDPAGELDDLEAASDLALGIGEDFAVLFGYHTRQYIVVAVQQFEKLEQDARPGQGWCRRPAGKRSGCRVHCPVDLPDAGKGDAAALLSGCRVVDIAPAS